MAEQTRKASRADAPDDILDASDLSKPVFSPVCTWCKFWAPERRGHHCHGAYPVGGPDIPEPIWSGANYHLSHYAGDHNVYFELHPDALSAMKKQNPGLAKAWAAREAQREKTGEQPTGPKGE